MYAEAALVARAGISVTWSVLSWSGGHEFESPVGSNLRCVVLLSWVLLEPKTTALPKHDMFSLFVGACGQVDRALDSRSEGLGFNSQSYCCVEVLGRLRIPYNMMSLIHSWIQWFPLHNLILLTSMFILSLASFSIAIWTTQQGIKTSPQNKHDDPDPKLPHEI